MARRELNQTMGEAWTLLKMDWAKALLKRHVMTVSQVAHQVGYEDQLYFSRVFRKHVGVSPRQWSDGSGR
jgi:AraC family transcriptional regulator of arabinose operon